MFYKLCLLVHVCSMHDQGIGGINKVFHAYSTDFHEGPGPVQTWMVCNNLGLFDILCNVTKSSGDTPDNCWRIQGRETFSLYSDSVLIVNSQSILSATAHALSRPWPRFHVCTPVHIDLPMDLTIHFTLCTIFTVFDQVS